MGLGKGLALALVGLLALQVLPSLLTAPAPPPLAADVGLPKVAIERKPPVAPSRSNAPIAAAPESHGHHAHLKRLPAQEDLDRKVSSKPKPRHRHKKRRGTPPPLATQAPPPPTESSLTPEPPPTPTPPPTPEPPPPADEGSMEFAPR